MFRAMQMSKITITGPKTSMRAVVEKLYELKALHIIEHKRSDILDIGKSFEESAEQSNAIVRVKSIISNLGVDKNINGKEIELNNKKELYKTLEKIESDVLGINRDKKEAEDGIGKIKIIKGKIEQINGLNLNLGVFNHYSSLHLFLGYVKGELKRDLNKVTDDYELFSYNDKKKGLTLIALFVKEDKKEEALNLLNLKGFAEIDYSSFHGLKGSCDQNLSELNAREMKLEEDIAKAEKRKNELKNKWGRTLLNLEEEYSVLLDKSEVPLKFAEYKNTFMANGWVLTSKLSRVEKELQAVSKDRLVIREVEVGKEEGVPVELKHSKLVQPFEFFLDLYALPKYKEIDPTFFMFLTFPLFFGFMLGDMGYGLVTLALFLFLRKKVSSSFRQLLNALIFASLSSIFFGALFGEVFGAEVLFGYHLPHVLGRAEEINELLYVAVAIGIVHVNIGLIIGFINVFRNHGLKHAILEKASWILLEAGVALTYFAYTGYGNKFVGFGLAALAVILIAMGEGVKGVIELPTIFSHILSYARLMAVGLASVSLAVVINEFAAKAFQGGIISIIFGILLLAIGHIVNIALGIISPFLHSLRLHYVEFFTKFYEGGAKRYVPFGRK